MIDHQINCVHKHMSEWLSSRNLNNVSASRTCVALLKFNILNLASKFQFWNYGEKNK